MSLQKTLSIFIGSSTKSKKYAVWLSELISEIGSTEADDNTKLKVSTWWENANFPLMNSFYDSLLKLLAEFDVAILIGAMDDYTIKSNVEIFEPRDNVIFELGLFAGAKGRESSLLISVGKTEAPSDLSGIHIIKSNETSNSTEFKNEIRPHLRNWLAQAIHQKHLGSKKYVLPLPNSEFEGIISEMIKDINDAARIDNKVFQSTIETSLNFFASEVNNWASGQLYIGQDRSVQFLISLYRSAKKVFATSVKDFSTAWKDNLFGDEILRAHKESSAQVTRVFWFTETGEVGEDDLEEMEKQKSYGVNVFLFFDKSTEISFPPDIARDYTIIDDEIIGVTESFGRNRNAAKYFFKDSNKLRAFRNISNRLIKDSISFEKFKTQLGKK
jgi:hypothetical protein